MGGESTIEYLSVDGTFVYWNMEDYPIPISADLDSIRPNIKSALRQMGFDRLMLIRAYGDKLSHDRSELCKAGILYTPETSGGENSAAIKMALDMVVTAAASHGEPRNLVVIAKQSPNRELHRVLKCLKSRNYTVLVVEPPDDTVQDGLFHSVDSIVDCTHVFGGGKPIRRRPQSICFSDTDEEDAKSNGATLVLERLRSNLIVCLGTVSQSGTSKFLDALMENKDLGADNGLIGQFGVVFYSAFLVAEKVVVSIKSPKSDKQYVWESVADSSSNVVREETDPENILRRGTQITLYLREDDKYEITESTRIKNLVKNYSQFLGFPIYTWQEKSRTIEVEEEEPGKEGEEGEPKKKKTTKTEKYWDWELANEKTAMGK